jgi:TRAP-type C4-dicarboxylate transport system permease small subunit
MTRVFAAPPATSGGIYNPAIDPKFGAGVAEDIVAELIANILKISFSIAGLILLGMLIYGGIQWLGSGGDKEAVAKAQKRITAALIGFIVYMSVFAIINFLAPVFGGLNILNITWPTP